MGGGGTPTAGSQAAKAHEKKKASGEAKPPARNFMKLPVARETLIPMGITSEEVSLRYGIKREDQDKLGFDSQSKAVLAQKQGLFRDEIVPVATTVNLPDGTQREVTV